MMRYRGSRHEIHRVLFELEYILSAYGCVLLEDYYQIINSASNSEEDTNVGWTSLSQAEIIHTDEILEYELILPRPYPIL